MVLARYVDVRLLSPYPLDATAGATAMILPIEPDAPISKLEYRETLIGLAMISKARSYGIEGDLLDMAEYVRLDLSVQEFEGIG